VQITFKFALSVNGGRFIFVESPEGYLLSCSTEGSLIPISLPERPDCNEDPLELVLPTSLVAGEYAFALAATIPDVPTPPQNTFSIIVKDVGNVVVDAAFNARGQDLRKDIKVANPTLAWSSSAPDERTIIFFGLTFLEEDIMVTAVLLNFPKRFVHDIRQTSDVQILNRNVKAAGVDVFTDRLMIRFGDADPHRKIQTGTYVFSLPMVVPCCLRDDFPTNNVWYLSLCDNQECVGPGDKGVLVSFPIAGFNMNDVATAPDALASIAKNRWQIRLSMVVVGILPAAQAFCGSWTF
jgi:hypothetical protein